MGNSQSSSQTKKRRRNKDVPCASEPVIVTIANSKTYHKEVSMPVFGGKSERPMDSENDLETRLHQLEVAYIEPPTRRAGMLSPLSDESILQQMAPPTPPSVPFLSPYSHTHRDSLPSSTPLSGLVPRTCLQRLTVESTSAPINRNRRGSYLVPESSHTVGHDEISLPIPPSSAMALLGHPTTLGSPCIQKTQALSLPDAQSQALAPGQHQQQQPSQGRDVQPPRSVTGTVIGTPINAMSDAMDRQAQRGGSALPRDLVPSATSFPPTEPAKPVAGTAPGGKPAAVGAAVGLVPSVPVPVPTILSPTARPPRLSNPDRGGLSFPSATKPKSECGSPPYRPRVMGDSPRSLVGGMGGGAVETFPRGLHLQSPLSHSRKALCDVPVAISENELEEAHALREAGLQARLEGTPEPCLMLPTIKTKV